MIRGKLLAGKTQSRYVGHLGIEANVTVTMIHTVLANDGGTVVAQYHSPGRLRAIGALPVPVVRRENSSRIGRLLQVVHAGGKGLRGTSCVLVPTQAGEALVICGREPHAHTVV